MTLAVNFLKLKQDMKPKIQEYKTQGTSGHNLVKLLKIKDKEKLLKVPRGQNKMINAR